MSLYAAALAYTVANDNSAPFFCRRITDKSLT